MADFEKAVAFVIDHLEGGDKVVADKGGVSKYGITSRFHPGINVPNLSREEAIRIYESEYWIPAGCQNFVWPINLVIFDAAVNQGVAVAVQIFLNAVDHLEALWERVDRYVHLAYHDLEYRQHFLGWMNRLVKLWKYTVHG